MRSVVELMESLDANVKELDTLSKRQDNAQLEDAAAADAWEELFDSFVEQLQDEWANEHKGAFPGQERLVSMCRRASPENREAWRRVKRAEFKSEKLARRSVNVSKQIGGLQSELKTLATEGAMA